MDRLLERLLGGELLKHCWWSSAKFSTNTVGKLNIKTLKTCLVTCNSPAFRLVRCNALHLDKKGPTPAFQIQKHWKTEINREKINGCPCSLQYILPTVRPCPSNSALNLVAIAKNRRLFKLQVFKILTRPKPQPKKCVQMETAIVDCEFAHCILCCILQKQHGFME
jgi:hypothetical protein